MPNTVKSLKSKRAGVKQRLTRFQTFITNPRNVDQKLEISRRLKDVEPCMREYEDYHFQIAELDPSQVRDTDLIAFENDYYKIITDAEKLLEKTDEAVSLPDGENCNVKLPDINLPSFSGSFVDWVGFRDSFKSLIHNNKLLNEIQKFHYLKSSLKDEALQTIDHLTPSIASYKTAWSLLEDRFDNNRLIVQHHVRAIFSLAHVTKDSKSLRQMIQTTTTHLKVLESLQRPVKQWDDLLIHIISSKLDHNTLIAWESSLGHEIPTYEQLEKFVVQRCQTLESLESVSISTNNKFNTNVNQSAKPIQKGYMTRPATHVSTSSIQCSICNQNHQLFRCKNFLEMTVAQRINEIKKHKLCQNCFKANHKADTCTHSQCRKCNRKHNTLLHIENTPENVEGLTPISSHCVSLISQTVILSTALIKVFDKNGKEHQLRALLDSASTSHFISENAARKLGLQTNNITLPVVGIGNNSTNIRKSTSLKIHSNYNRFSDTLSCLIISRITSDLPAITFDKTALSVPKNIKLADPQFNVSSEIDILIGASLFWKLLCIGQIQNSDKGPVFQKTYLGWVISGNIPVIQPSVCNFSVAAFDEFDNRENKCLLQEHVECERLFKQSVTRNSSGLFVVKLPFKSDPPSVGFTKHAAISRLKSIERKFLRDPQLKSDYTAFMREYLEMGHMQKLKEDDDGTQVCCYIPHHHVVKPDSETSKIRIVFDASVKSSNGKSLNDNLYVGESLQQELFSILVRFRVHQFILSADCAKMYRMILVDPEHCKRFQRILWRFNSTEKIQTYQLNTVTYGFASSPFLAIRCLQELAKTEAVNFPDSYKIILRDFYVDDLLTGCDSMESAYKIRDEVTEILRKGGFELRKWSSNIKELLPKNCTQSKTVHLISQPEKKTLGLCRNSESDTIKFIPSDIPFSNKATKRTILSTLAHVYDPVGIISPTMVTVKILLQKLWSLKLNWDESIPENLYTMWAKFLQEFKMMEQITIPRKTIPQHPTTVQIHGFSDASQSSYGACVYVRCKNENETYTSHLLCSKHRVAPLRATTIPKLELCAAVLLAELMNKLRTLLDINVEKYFYWTDSEVVLAWLKTDPAKLKIYVANRVTKIQELSKITDWSYVKSKQNPADILSRGMAVKQLQKSFLWWHGPEFLLQPASKWPYKNIIQDENLPEIKPSKYKNNDSTSDSSRKAPSSLTLSRNELNNAHDIIIKISQRESFHNDIESLKKDQKGLLRVGGRLRHAPIQAKPKSYQQLMGDLPESRVRPSRPFQYSSIDYAGPILLKNGRGRTTKRIKGYIAIFVCFATKATHIELVCDCTTESFLNALKRFVARRGKVDTIYSDNAKNFVGADRELKSLYNLLQSPNFQKKVIDHLINQKICWKFMPPRAPHFGGLHEAAVKSAKNHLRRVVKNAVLDFESMYTLLTMVEACMNSRPLSPLSSDPTDLQALTPGHFLVGDSLLASAEADLTEVAPTRLSQYQRLEQMRQHFWKRWAAEYRNNLQQRYKWATISDQPKLGALVLLKEDDAPPLQWPLGRIEELHPGKDGLTRVVTVRTVRGAFKRPVTKICAIPIEGGVRE
ncbi:uncharacterized protein LOC135131698 [Zophobas morio]|uniref:uncharacterized protein LOC135131698 n=1 Tax=Zophobas morio TaxID=2755281 RepID=UPI00308351BA